MNIQLKTKYVYDIADLSKFKKLKKNIQTMGQRGQQDRLDFIYQQVLPFAQAPGSTPVEKNAHELCHQLMAILNIKPSAAIIPATLTTQAVEPPLAISKQLPAHATRPVKITPSYAHPAQAPVIISYRDEQGKRMHAAFYDHYTFRHITQHDTKISCAEKSNTNQFKSFIEQTTLALGIGSELGDRVIPKTHVKQDEPAGLLVIPGRSRNEQDTLRSAHEQKLIQEARRKGQPILAICAGSWCLWEAFGGKVIPVSDHLYANMPYIVTDGSLGNNKQIHRIKLTPATLVHGAMHIKQATPLRKNPTVNSIHWAAPDSTTTPNMLVVSAVAVPDADMVTNNRQGEQMHPEADTVEAFETAYGAPMVGIQWHPEAYYKTNPGHKVDTDESQRHLNLIIYMAKAGDAYQAKRLMLEDLKLKMSQSTLLGQHGLYKTCNSKEGVEVSGAKAKPNFRAI